MGLKDILATMRIIEPEASRGVPAPGPGAAAAVKPAPTMADVLATLPPPPRLREEALQQAADAGAITSDFPSIYAAAGIREPAHGFSAFKVLEMLSSPHLAPLEPRARAAALRGFLAMNPGGPVSVEEVLQDAIRRDQALDAYEQFLRRKLDASAQEVTQQNAALQAEIDALVRKNKEKMEANMGRLAGEQQALTAWLEKKRAEESRLADATAPFVEKSPISRS